MSELGPEARALIDLARDADDPSPADRQRIRRRLATVAAAATVVATAAHTAKAASVATSSAFAGTVTTGKVAAVLLSGFAAGAVAAGGAAVWLDDEAPPPRPAVVAAPSARAQVTPSANLSIPRADHDETSEAEAAVSERDSASRATAVPRPARPEAPTLARETQLLEGARAALARGDARQALNLVAEHGRSFPRGAMKEEATVTRILALCQLGQVTAARQAANVFLATAPRSPLRSRVLSSCAAGSLSETEKP